MTANTSEQTANHSATLHQEARHYMPGGVNSPVRAFSAVNTPPRIMKSANGAYVFDVDGQRYIDYVGAFGPAIVGHAHPAINTALTQTLANGLCFGATCDKEVALAKRVLKHVPFADKIRFVNSGTEATMTALRLARGITKRDKIIKFSGCYHGHSDQLLVQAGSGALRGSSPP